MSRALLRLVGVTVGVWLVTALPAGLMAGHANRLWVSGAAAGICLVPSVVTLALTLRLQGRPPEERIVAVLGGVAIRMTFVVAGGVILYFTLPIIREYRWAFLAWGVMFYLITLATETTLVMSVLTGRDPKSIEPRGPERSQR